MDEYVALMKELFDFGALKAFLATGFSLRMDCMHGGECELLVLVYATSGFELWRRSVQKNPFSLTCCLTCVRVHALV